MRVQGGDAVVLDGAGERVIVGASAGWAEVRDVTAPDGRVGMVAFKPNGDWWWVRTLHAPDSILPKPFSLQDPD